MVQLIWTDAAVDGLTDIYEYIGVSTRFGRDTNI